MVGFESDDAPPMSYCSTENLKRTLPGARLNEPTDVKSNLLLHW